MKKNVRTLVLSVSMGLLVLAGCDNPADSDDGNWLAKEQNPFIGTWGYTVTVYYEVTKSGENAFSWKTASDASTANGYQQFDGENFAITN